MKYLHNLGSVKAPKPGPGTGLFGADWRWGLCVDFSGLALGRSRPGTAVLARWPLADIWKLGSEEHSLFPDKNGSWCINCTHPMVRAVLLAPFWESGVRVCAWQRVHPSEGPSLSLVSFPAAFHMYCHSSLLELGMSWGSPGFWTLASGFLGTTL